MSSDSPILCTWPSDFGLMSFDIESLYLLTYAKISEAKFKMKRKNHSRLNLMRHSLPHLKIADSKFVHSTEEIVQYFKNLNSDCDSNFPESKRADIDAFKRLFMETLLPAIEYHLWLDPKNSFVVNWYRTQLPMPLNLIIPSQIRLRKKLLCSTIFKFDEQTNSDVVKKKISRECNVAFNLLNNRLSESSYLFGEMPSSADAFIYAILAPLNNLPLDSSNIQNFFKACPNLTAFVRRISVKYFSSENVKVSDTQLLDKLELLKQASTVAFGFSLVGIYVFGIYYLRHRNAPSPGVIFSG